ncbi:MAG: capsular polysaccharide biosynthesis protein, partial [Gammaproteobacteria bacterium]
MESDRRFDRILTFSRGIARIPHLCEFLQAREVVYAGCYPRRHKADCVVGWGRKPNTQRARRYAEQNRLPYLSLEDGFLRSVGLAVNGYPPLSLIIDDIGMYYDAATPSRLEAWLNAPPDPADLLGSTDLLRRAERCMQRMTRAGLSKYNDAPPASDPFEPTQPQRVLVVDQTVGDLSVRYGMGTAQAFAAMVEAALDEHPQAEVLVKTHPDVLAGTKRGYLTVLHNTDRIRVIAQNLNPAALLATVDHVYVVTSLLGFEALMLGKPVTCFGAPFYAGWGLTDDRISIPRRTRRRTLAQLFAAAYILYPCYIDPDTGKRAAIEQVVAHLETQRHYFKANQGRICCLGFSFWKRNYIRAYLKAPGNQIQFVRSLRQVRQLRFDPRLRIAVWGSKARADLAALARDYGTPIWRIEDGFLRSVGLCSDLTAPASLVVDRRGIYFDPAGISDLEHLLENERFTQPELDRARQLRAVILAMGLSKYNVGSREHLAVPTAPAQTRILVPGQVPDDASVRLGAREVGSDTALLR